MQNIICDDKYNNNNNNRFVMTTNKWKNDEVQNLTTKNVWQSPACSSK